VLKKMRGKKVRKKSEEKKRKVLSEILLEKLV
jgi:hypothetical protein